MKFVVCVVVAIICVNTIKALKSKQVNLALETVLNFDQKDRKADLTVIDKIQNFLDQIKNAMQRSTRRSNKRDVKFADFILKAAKILKDYNDNDLEDAYVIINDESKRYINTESEFQDLFDGNDMRRFVSDQLDEAKEMPADILRRNLDVVVNFIESRKKTGKESDLLDIGNTLYDGASDKFMFALRNLKKIRRAGEANLERLLRDTLRSLVFDHYSNLNRRVRGELINMVKHYWRAFSGKNNDKQHTRSKLTTDVTGLRHEGRGKPHKERASSPTDRTHSKSKPYRMQKKDSSYKALKNKPEDFLTNQELNTLINNTDAPEEISESDKSYRYPENKEILRNKPKMRGFELPQLHRGAGKKHDRTEARDTIEKSSLSDSSGDEILMGGQIHLRAESSSKQVSEGSDRAEDESSTEEIVIQHSNIVDVGLSRKTPGRLNITFGSSEIHKTGSSSEGSIPYKIMRKSNVNDTFKTDPHPRDYSDVNMILKKIEKEIEDVKEEVEYVKNLTRSIKNDNEESLSSEKTLNVTGVETSKTDNVFAFRAHDDSDITNSSPAKADSGFAFRAHSDSDTNSSPEVDDDSKKEVTEKFAIKSNDSTGDNAKNESKISDAIENTSASNVTKETPDKSLERKGDTGQIQDANKDILSIYATNATTGAKLDENDEHKDEDEDNSITENNFNSTATFKLLKL